MVSKINIAQFRERLNKNTKYGNPRIKGTPFAVFSISGESNKSFYGTYDKAKFELTKNSTLFPAPFIISGKINSKNNTQTEITYEVKPIGFGYYWLKYMPTIGILMFNLVLYTQSEPSKVYIIINPIIFGFAIISRFYLLRKKKKLVTDFEKVFEIKT
ncbi:hypothetical protein IUY40_06910 [Flavobacterium sp. ALJ2]|uniref:hypothetical protein n=1 Tax=Flavobacterium sp. ALJ2 TaxID=2786960 RepID=UPI00189C8DC9|nr:hypothetical protein [Flavobacterium sp. ALJ2]MBF7091265.1 hypothetical protein [Flavobacterium sp. ALJ2]